MKTTLPPLIQAGDFVRIDTPRMALGWSEIIKVNRTTFNWRSEYFGHPIEGRLEMSWLGRATVKRGDIWFSVL